MEFSLNLLFDPSEDTAIHWAARTGLEHALDLRHVEQLYARALPYLKNWAWALAAKHGWTDEAVDAIGDMPLAVCLGRDEMLQSTDGELLAYSVSRLVLPLHFSDFLHPEFSEDFNHMFQKLTTPTHPNQDSSEDIYQLGRAGIPRPLQNILYLLQILSPGLLVIREDDDELGNQGIDRALPSSIWVGLHIEDLEDIFGAQTALKIYQAAEDPYCASEDSASFNGSFGSQDYFDSSSDTSGFTLDSDEDWSLPEYGDLDILLPYNQPCGPVEAGQDTDHSFLASFNKHEDTHHLIAETNNAFIANFMDYRHCDSDCSFCGMCSDRFAERLTERLLMHGALVAM
jgi:hypothetical protein